MKLEEFCFLFGLMIVPISFYIFPKLYLNNRNSLYFFIVTSIIAIIGLSTIEQSNSIKPNLYLFLVCPFLSFSLLKIELFVFRKIVKRDPKDPPRRFLDDDGLDRDRLFYFIFSIVSLCLPMFILAYFYG